MHALRTRVNRSAIGSVIIFAKILYLPTGFGDTRDLTFQREISETDTADTEPSQVGPWATATIASVVGPNFELRLPLRLYNECFLGHKYLFF
jgi:hypothetical protein